MQDFCVSLCPTSGGFGSHCGVEVPQHPISRGLLGVSTSSEPSQPTLGRFGGYWGSPLSVPGS